MARKLYFFLDRYLKVTRKSFSYFCVTHKAFLCYEVFLYSGAPVGPLKLDLALILLSHHNTFVSYCLNWVFKFITKRRRSWISNYVRWCLLTSKSVLLLLFHDTVYSHYFKQHGIHFTWGNSKHKGCVRSFKKFQNKQRLYVDRVYPRLYPRVADTVKMVI